MLIIMKVREIKEKLTELKIAFKTNLKKSDLESLLPTIVYSPPEELPTLKIGSPVKIK